MCLSVEKKMFRHYTSGTLQHLWCLFEISRASLVRIYRLFPMDSKKGLSACLSPERKSFVIIPLVLHTTLAFNYYGSNGQNLNIWIGKRVCMHFRL